MRIQLALASALTLCFLHCGTSDPALSVSASAKGESAVAAGITYALQFAGALTPYGGFDPRQGFSLSTTFDYFEPAGGHPAHISQRNIELSLSSSDEFAPAEVTLTPAAPTVNLVKRSSKALVLLAAKLQEKDREVLEKTVLADLKDYNSTMLVVPINCSIEPSGLTACNFGLKGFRTGNALVLREFVLSTDTTAEAALQIVD